MAQAVVERNKRSHYEVIEAAETVAEGMPNPPAFEISDRGDGGVDSRG
jgi:hypothetical protein